MSTQDVTGADLFAPLRGSGNPELEPGVERTSDAVRSGVGGDSKPKRLRLSGKMIVIDITPEEPEEDEQP
jgi:hypothetical protein